MVNFLPLAKLQTSQLNQPRGWFSENILIAAPPYRLGLGSWNFNCILPFNVYPKSKMVLILNKN